MKSIMNFIRSVRRDAPIVGYCPYLRYRYKSYRGQKKPMTVEIAGQSIHVRPGTPDLIVAFQSLRHEFDILAKALPSSFSGIIVDAGGYIGTAALKLSTMYPEATIVSIEPSDTNFVLLLRNIENTPKIHAIKAALFTESDKAVPLQDRGTGDWGFSIALSDPSSAKGDLGDVMTITLEDIAARFPGQAIGLIKLDIEGGEHALFKDPASILQDIPAVFVELHDRIVPGCTEAFLTFSATRWIVNAGGEKLLSLKGKPDALQS